MRQWLKGVLTRLAPITTAGILAARSRQVVQAAAREHGCIALNDRLITAFGEVVQTGPFRGLRLGGMARAEHLGPYLLGTYEGELHPQWERLLWRSYSQVIDVGSKFGYYAVGLGLRLAGVPVVAFDTDPWARQATRETAAMNDAKLIQVEGFCTPAWLDKQLLPNAMIVSDCEGYEGTLFSGYSAPLDTATLVIETHDHVVPLTSQRLRARFAPTHDLVEISSGLKPNAVGVDLAFLTAEEQSLATNEFRAFNQSWLVFQPRGAA